MEMIRSFIGSDVLEKKIITLKRKCRFLESKKVDIEEEFKHEESSSMKKRRKEVEMWLMNVESVKHEVQSLAKEVTESTLTARLRLERRVDNFTTEVTELIEQSKFPRGLTIEACKNEGVAFLTKRLVGEKFQQNKDMIWNCVINGEESIIGVYGMGGIGKTTLLMHIHNQLLNHSDFEVAWVTVPQNSSIQELQRAIAKTIIVDIANEDDEKTRAAILAMALKKKRKFVLILDDVWEQINLDQVGICIGLDGFKLILTTRSLRVCRMMSCQTLIKVEPLSPIEAWELFVETLGNNEILISYKIEEIAQSIVQECGGLPLGIIIAAGSMRGVDEIDEWRNALEEIKSSENWHDDMDFFEVFRVLKYSYDKLRDSKLQQCLLYCSLFPEDAVIDKNMLIEYFIVENLIEGRTNRKSMFYKGHAMLKRLENVCLLEGQMYGQEKRYVKMHDLVRDMAIKIASEKHPFLVRSGMRLKNIPDGEEWSQNLVRVSLMRNKISNIHFDASPRCPRLSTLLLNENSGLKVIPQNFFTNMVSLSILDLSDTSVESLPTSISNLESLIALLLRNCKALIHVPSLAKLTSLRKLDLSGTSVQEVPHGLERLVNLRYLNLDRCLIKDICSGIFSKFSYIEHLSAFTTWFKGEEMGRLGNLESFRGQFHNVDDLNKCFKSLERRKRNKVYNLKVMLRENLFPVMLEVTSSDKQEHLEDISIESQVAEEPFVFPVQIETLLLDGLDSIQSACGISSLTKVNRASRICNIDGWNGMRYNVSPHYCSIPFAESIENFKIVGSLKALELIAREVKPSFSSTVIQSGTFSSLKQFHISECHNLKTLFMPALLSNLQNLETLEVKHCKQLVELIGATEEDEKESSTKAIQSLPNLKSLRLYLLQNLKSLCGSSIRVPDALEEIAIMYCWELKWISLLREERYPHPSLEKVYVENDCWDLMEWKHPQTKAVFQPYLNFARPSFFY